MALKDDSEILLNKRTILTIILSVIVVVSGFLGYTYLFGTQDPFPVSGQVVYIGDNISVDYTGMFEDGTVFDTSITDIAYNDILYPKSSSFTRKGSYEPLSFAVGTGAMIEGFDVGVIGMVINETKTVTVPPDKGYGEPDENLYVTIDLVETLPIFVGGMNKTDFSSKYYTDAVIGKTIKDTEWGWNATVYFIDPETDEVILKWEPYIGEIIDYNGVWTSEVISIDNSANSGTGEITISHMLLPEDAGVLYGNFEDSMFFVKDVDLDAATATLDYNREVVGKTLIFKITIVSIEG